MTRPLVLAGTDPSDARVAFSDFTQPHDDARTWLRVHLSGEGLSAACAIETLGGDDGQTVDPGAGEGVRPHESVRLSQLLVDLGSGPLWEGTRHWRTINGELAVELVVDRHGHVDVTFRLVPLPWHATWMASTTLGYALGDLIGAGRDLANWVDIQSLP